MTSLEKLKAAGATAYTDAEVDSLAVSLATSLDPARFVRGRLLVTLLEQRRPPGPFLLLSFKRGAWGNSAVWWGSDGGGYYSRLESAGRYSEAEARAIADRSPFDMGRKDTVAVPESEALAVAQLAVDYNEAVKRWSVLESDNGK